MSVAAAAAAHGDPPMFTTYLTGDHGDRPLLTLGTCVEVRGQVTTGSFPLFQLPLSPDGSDSLKLSIVIVSGALDGPTFLITANIHGDEVTGTLICHRQIAFLQSRLATMRGRVVFFPSLNPTGQYARACVCVFVSVAGKLFLCYITLFSIWWCCCCYVSVCMCMSV